MISKMTIGGGRVRNRGLETAVGFVLDRLEGRVLLTGVWGGDELAMMDRGAAVVMAAQAEGVQFGDAALEAVVREALNKPAGEITRQDMLGLVKLDAGYRGIRSLEGLEYATNLKSLYLASNQIGDIGPLASLGSLEWVHLGSNRITDLRPLSGMTHVRTVILDFNGLTDVSVLGSLSGLVSLHLGSNRITDASPLAGLDNLAILDLTYNDIADVSPLLGMRKLDNLRLANNLLDLSIGSQDRLDLAALKRRGVHLEVGGQRLATTPREAYPGASQDVRFPDAMVEQIVRETLNKLEGDISAEDMLGLTALDMTGQGIRSLSGLEFARNLKTLEASSNHIADLSPLAGLSKLQYLDLGNNDIADLSALADLTNLDTLYLDNNDIRDISALSRLTKVFEMGLGGNQINDVTALSGLTALVHLHLINNQISDLSALSGLPNLRVLVAHNNHVSSLSFVAGLSALRTISVSGNQITDLSPLVALSDRLESIDVGWNWLTDISVLREMTALHDVHVSNNYLDLSEGSAAAETIALLTARGIDYLYYQPQRELPTLVVPQMAAAKAGMERRVLAKPVVALGTKADDAYYIKRVGNKVIISGGTRPGGKILARLSLAKARQLVLDLRGGNDLLTVDFSRGNPLPEGGLNLMGGNGGDTLRFVGVAGQKAVAIKGEKVQVAGGTITAGQVDRVQVATMLKDGTFSIKAIKRKKG